MPAAAPVSLLGHDELDELVAEDGGAGDGRAHVRRDPHAVVEGEGDLGLVPAQGDGADGPDGHVGHLHLRPVGQVAHVAEVGGRGALRRAARHGAAGQPQDQRGQRRRDEQAAARCRGAHQNQLPTSCSHPDSSPRGADVWRARPWCRSWGSGGSNAAAGAVSVGSRLGVVVAGAATASVDVAWLPCAAVTRFESSPPSPPWDELEPLEPEPLEPLEPLGQPRMAPSSPHGTVVVVVLGGTVVVVVVVGAAAGAFCAGCDGGAAAPLPVPCSAFAIWLEALLEQRLGRGRPAPAGQRVEDGRDVVEQRVEEARGGVAALGERGEDGGREARGVVGHDAPADAGQPVAQEAGDVGAGHAGRRLEVQVQPVVGGVVGALGPLEEAVAVLEDLVDRGEVAVQRPPGRGQRPHIRLERRDVGHEQGDQVRAGARQLGDGVVELARVLGQGGRHRVVLRDQMLDLAGVRVERAGQLGQRAVQPSEVVALVGQQLHGAGGRCDELVEAGPLALEVRRQVGHEVAHRVRVERVERVLQLLEHLVGGDGDRGVVLGDGGAGGKVGPARIAGVQVDVGRPEHLGRDEGREGCRRDSWSLAPRPGSRAPCRPCSVRR